MSTAFLPALPPARLARVARVACLSHDTRTRPPCICRARVPSDATTAVADIKHAVRAALLAGRRALCVDVLTAAVDPRAPTYDQASAATVLLALVHAMQPILPSNRPEVRVIVTGPVAALRVREWLRDAATTDVSVSVLGVQDDSPPPYSPPVADNKEHQQFIPSAAPAATAPEAFIVIDPPVDGEAVLHFRRFLRAASDSAVPLIVHNHPRQDTLYQMLGFAGHIPFELTKFEPAFVLAPFALKSDSDPTDPPPRFVVLRKYPHTWGIWKFEGDGERPVPRHGTDPLEMEQLDEYRLCAQFHHRPFDEELLQVIKSSIT